MLSASKKIHAFTLPSLMTVLSLAACGPSMQPTSSTSIFGGTAVADGELPAVVALAHVAPGEREAEVECTGTLIGADTVLTAAHCLPAIGNRTQLKVFFGNGAIGGKLLVADGIDATRTVVHPNYRAHPFGDADLAEIVLSEKILGIEPLPIVMEFDEWFAATHAERALLVGFGRREGGVLGEKYQVTAILGAHTSDEIAVGGSGRDACDGDSGGPVLSEINGSPHVLGVISRGRELTCGPGAYATFAAEWESSVEDSLHAIQVDLNLPDRLSVAAYLANAETLTFDFLMLSDLSPFSNLHQLKSLSLRGNRITDVTPLANLSGLQELHLEGNDITDWSPLDRAAAQGLLIFGRHQQLSSYSKTAFLGACQSLATVSESVSKTVRAILWTMQSDDCAIANQRLLATKTLNLADRGLTDLSPLANLERLEALDLANNPITDVTPLAGLESLHQLDLSGTQVTDLTPLAPLRKRGLRLLGVSATP